MVPKAWFLAPLGAVLFSLPALGQEPEELEAQAKEAFVKMADELIYDDNYDSASSARYKVKTDDPRLVSNRTLELLDSFGSFFESYWSGKIDLRPYDQTGRIYLFYSRFKYKKLFEGSQVPEASVGHYRVAIDIIAAHTDTVGPELPDVLVHEATHQLLNQRIYGAEDESSLWIQEGMACYFGHMLRDKSGAFEPAEIGGKSISVFKEGAKSGQGMGKMRLRGYTKALKEGVHAPLDRVVKIMDDGAFYGSQENYIASWLLVHYLWHADQGSHAAGFVRYLKREVQDGPDVAAFYKEIAMTPQELQASFEAYVKKLK